MRYTTPPHGWAVKGFIIIVLVILSVVVTYFSVIRQTDPFFYEIVATAKHSYIQGELECAPTRPSSACRDYRGQSLLLHHLASITNLSPGILQFFPIGLFLVPLIWVLLLSRVSSDWLAVALFTVPFIANPSYLIGHPSTSTYVWSRTLYFNILLSIIILLRVGSPTQRRGVQIVLVVLTFGMVNTYQSGTGWTLFTFFFAAGALLLARDRRASIFIGFGLLIGILLAMMPNTQRQLLYVFVLSRYETPTEGLLTFFNIMLELAGLREASGVYYPTLEQTFIESTGQTIWNAARLLRYPILFITIALLSWPYASKLKERVQSPQLHWRTVLILAIAGTAALHTLIYISRGRFSLRYASVTFPILILALAEEVEWPRVARVSGAAFAVVSVMALGGFIIATGFTPIGADYTTESGTNWMTEYSNTDREALSDFHTLGAIQVHSVGQSTAIHQTYYNDNRYRWVAYGGGEQPDTELIILNTAQYNRNIIAPGWHQFPPFKAYRSSHYELHLATNQSVQQVYDDGQVIIYANE